jgi:hypothetical protein
MEEQKFKDDEIEGVDNSSSESPHESNPTTMEYPTKLKLIMIVVALILSMFLVCLLLESLLDAYERY